QGTHEGVDFYTDQSCQTIDVNTPVLAAKAGTIVRIDRAYSELTLDQYSAAEAAGFQGETILDMFRGRQVWIDHGQGVVTRYAHLSSVVPGLERGDSIDAGRVVGFVGESGTPESLFAPGTDEHLHFEIRVGDSYLGQGLDPFAARALYLEAFGIAEDGAP
ncbi:MAG: M23 family metallopeptidase, partial [Dehalococcoidia bacterium]